MESVYDTEIQEVYPQIYLQGTDKTQEFESFISPDERSTEYDNQTAYMLDLDETASIAQTQSEIVVTLSNEPKTFEQSGFEVAVVLCLAMIIGLFLWDKLSKRWFS